MSTEHCSNIERWQGPPNVNKEKNVVLTFNLVSFSLFQHKKQSMFVTTCPFPYMYIWTMSSILGKATWTKTFDHLSLFPAERGFNYDSIALLRVKALWKCVMSAIDILTTCWFPGTLICSPQLHWCRQGGCICPVFSKVNCSAPWFASFLIFFRYELSSLIKCGRWW